MKLFCDCWGCIPDLLEIKSVMTERTNTFMFKENTKLATFYNKETEFNSTPWNHHPSIIII